MAEGLGIAIELMETIFIKTTTFGGNFWLIQITIVLATLALLSRRKSDWKTLAFPVIIGWHSFGLRMPWIFLVASGTMFVIESLSLKTVESAIAGVKSLIVERSYDTPKKKLARLKEDRKRSEALFEGKRLDIREEIEKMKIRKKGFPMILKEKKSEAKYREELIKEHGTTNEKRIRRMLEEERKKRLEELRKEKKIKARYEE